MSERIYRYPQSKTLKLEDAICRSQNETVNVYIAGPMTGLPDYNYENFTKAASLLKSLGLHPVHTANTPRGRTWLCYIEESLKVLRDCDAIFLLKGYEKSKGALIEQREAEEAGIPTLIGLSDELKALAGALPEGF